MFHASFGQNIGGKCQFKQFNITPKNCEKKHELITPTTHPDIFALLNDLHDRVITGNNAIGAVNSFTKKYPEYKELIYKILNRNLKEVRQNNTNNEIRI